MIYYNFHDFVQKGILILETRLARSRKKQNCELQVSRMGGGFRPPTEACQTNNNIQRENSLMDAPGPILPRSGGHAKIFQRLSVLQQHWEAPLSGLDHGEGKRGPKDVHPHNGSGAR